MSRIIELVEMNSEENIIIWGVKEVTGVNPAEELDFTVKATFYSDEEATVLDFTLSYPGRKPLNFNVVFYLNNEITFNGLLRNVQLVFISEGERNLERLKESYFRGGTCVNLPENTIEELKFHKEMFDLKKGK